MGSKDRAASPMHRRCIGDASATSAWGNMGSTSSRIVDASAMRRDPLTPSRTPSRRPRTWGGTIITLPERTPNLMLLQ
eukprot:8593928-Pyramimonas_sp.AAC.1